jgi:type IV pilus assembly protein PilY1
LDRVGRYFDNTDNKQNPIVQECQQNFTILFTDGYWNGDSPSSINDSDGDGQSVTTVADIAHYYYTRDLSPLNKKQTMTTFTVAFGVKGKLKDTDNDGWPNPVLTPSSNWGDPSGNVDKPEKIDDLWHAAFNSDGRFVSAETPEEVANALSDALDEISNRVGTASSASFSTTTLNAESAVFLAQFNTLNNRWSGDLKSFKLNEQGELSPNYTWSAATKLEQIPASSRHIFTYDDNLHKGVPFSWNTLSEFQKNDLRINPDGSSSDANNDAKSKARLKFLRGERNNEVSSSGSKRGTFAFRHRPKLLGDIIHAAPVFVGTPELFWPNIAPFPTGSQSYNSFKVGNAKTRKGVVYSGANDGFLHGFYSADGREALAYMPNNIFSNNTSTSSRGVHYLTDTNYSHRYYVDMPLTVSDVYIKKGNSPEQWRTILIGGGRKGSRGLFALDVTNPTQFTQTAPNADKLVLWEFDQNDDPNLGYTFSKPSIALMNNGRWAAIFGNGYNNTGDGTASLFIVFLDGGENGTWEKGTDYLNITTKVGSSSANCDDCNGLSTPQAIDIDGNQVIDRIYAGDLEGNLWAFDVSSNDENNWGIAYGNINTPKPLFIAQHNNKPQPITLKPIVVKHPEAIGGAPDVLVFFGTGQYLTDLDPADEDTQSFYGVWDQGNHSLTPNNLVEQTFLTGTFRNNNTDVTQNVRVLTDKPIDYQTKKGWYINLTLASAERVIVDPDIRGGLLFFNTWIPDSSPCGEGGSGFLMSVNQVNGGRTTEATFDLDGDGEVNDDDLVTTADGESYAPSGQVFNLGLPASSSFLNNQQYTPGTSAPEGSTNPPIHTRAITAIGVPKTGRLSWQELRP